MTSYRQIEANRRNALKSTGPQTEAGKQSSRRNAIRHGLTAETVIGAMGDAEDYKAFEAAVIADYDAQSSANLYCDSPVSCGGCVARRRWKPVYSKFKPTICRTIGKIADFYRILATLFIPCFDELSPTRK